jgi:hypothetical protein
VAPICHLRRWVTFAGGQVNVNPGIRHMAGVHVLKGSLQGMNIFAASSFTGMVLDVHIDQLHVMWLSTVRGARLTAHLHSTCSRYEAVCPCKCHADGHLSRIGCYHNTNWNLHWTTLEWS